MSKIIDRYLGALKYRTKTYINFKRGWKTNRHLVVIESDDWGSIRMPSVDALDRLTKNGVSLFPELGYDRYDTLASNEDLEFLLEVLGSVKDNNGNPARITQNCVMVNPVFDKIKESGFREYYYEPFTETLQRLPNHDRSFALWKEGYNNGMLKPQFHGREHLNVPLWLRSLQEGIPSVRCSFDEGVFSMTFESKGKNKHCLAAYNAESPNDYSFYKKSISEGLRLFEDLFGFKSLSMIAPCYLWDDVIEEVASQNGVRFIQGNVAQVYSTTQVLLNKKNNAFHCLGETNRFGQYYLIRNCLFEPAMNPRYNSENCLNSIRKAFCNNKPAIISSHRQNYIGCLDNKNRDNNLKDLTKLLKGVIKEYPDVEFVFSDEMGSIIENNVR